VHPPSPFMYHPELFPELAKKNVRHEPIPLNKKNRQIIPKRNKLEGIKVVDANFTLEKLTYKSVEDRDTIEQDDYTNKYEIAPFLEDIKEMAVKRFIPNEIEDYEKDELNYKRVQYIDKLTNTKLKEKLTHKYFGDNSDIDREIFETLTPQEIYEKFTNFKVKTLTENEIKLKLVKDGIVKGDERQINRKIKKEIKLRKVYEELMKEKKLQLEKNKDITEEEIFKESDKVEKVEKNN